MEDLDASIAGEKPTVEQAYFFQKRLNQKMGEILEISRTFSLYLNLERVMNQIVRVVGESLGYGFVGLYLRDEKTNRMRVANYIDSSFDITTVELPSPGVDWDLLEHISQSSSNLKMIGGKRLRINFGDDLFGAGDGDANTNFSGSSEIWELNEYLLALVRLEGSTANGYIRVGYSLNKSLQDPMNSHHQQESNMFCHQALWIFANQAVVAIENALLFEKAQNEIEDRRQTEKELALAKTELEKHIQTRTLRLEKVNQDLHNEMTRRESTQIELDVQKVFLRQVLDANPTLIYVRDRTGRYTLVNEAAAKFEGISVEDIQGKLVSELNHDISQVIRWRHEDLDVIDNHREMVLSVERVKDTHGGEHFFQTIKRPILSNNGQPDQVLGVSTDISALKRAEERAIQANVDLAHAYDATIEGWSRALDFRDQDTEGHSSRVTSMMLKLTEALGIDRCEYQVFRRGALLHDIGKMGIPDHILRKEGPLSPSEWAIMRQHPVIAYKMLSPIEYLSKSLVIPHYHHEKWDGKGYPDGLEGDMIPLGARIFAVVDVWDALTSNRPYRKAWEKEKALDYINNNAGAHFDPRIVPVFIQHLERIISIN